jgi:Tfp pilus assembly protein PilN
MRLEGKRKMNIDINILPAELRPKALIDTRTFALVVVILLLGFGCFYFFNAKSDSQAEIANLGSQIKTIQQQTATLSSNPEAVNLISSINQLKAAKQGYEAFVASRVMWGNALAGVYSLVPTGVNIASITQQGNNLVIAGSSSSGSPYTNVSDYGRALDNDPRFTLTGLPLFDKGSFSLTIRVATGGGR